MPVIEQTCQTIGNCQSFRTLMKPRVIDHDAGGMFHDFQHPLYIFTEGIRVRAANSENRYRLSARLERYR